MINNKKTGNHVDNAKNSDSKLAVNQTKKDYKMENTKITKEDILSSFFDKNGYNGYNSKYFNEIFFNLENMATINSKQAYKNLEERLTFIENINEIDIIGINEINKVTIVNKVDNLLNRVLSCYCKKLRRKTVYKHILINIEQRKANSRCDYDNERKQLTKMIKFMWLLNDFENIETIDIKDNMEVVFNLFPDSKPSQKVIENESKIGIISKPETVEKSMKPETVEKAIKPKRNYSAIVKKVVDNADVHKHTHDYSSDKKKRKKNRNYSDELFSMLRSDDISIDKKRITIRKELASLRYNLESYCEHIGKTMGISAKQYYQDSIYGEVEDKIVTKFVKQDEKLTGELDALTTRKKVSKAIIKQTRISMFRVDNDVFLEGTVYSGYERFVIRQILWNKVHNYRNFILATDTPVGELINEAVWGLLKEQKRFTELCADKSIDKSDKYKFIGKTIKRQLKRFTSNLQSEFTIPEGMTEQAGKLMTSLNKYFVNKGLTNTQSTNSYIQRKVYEEYQKKQVITRIDVATGEVKRTGSKLTYRTNNKGLIESNIDRYIEISEEGEVPVYIKQIVNQVLTHLSSKERYLEKINTIQDTGLSTAKMLRANVNLQELAALYPVVYDKYVLGMRPKQIANKNHVSLPTMYAILERQLDYLREDYYAEIETKVYIRDYNGLRRMLNGESMAEIELIDE